VTPTADLLATIVAATLRITAVREAQEPLAELSRRADRRPPPPVSFRAALSRRDRVNVIAECKRRSPSRGVLRQNYDAGSIGRGYAAAGAAAISVLTEPTFFDGALADLDAVAMAAGIPALRKDFIVSQYQLLEARAAGAAAILLIVAALSDHELRTLAEHARRLGLDVLVEVHDGAELQRAIDAGADIIGVNNRNLRTLDVNVRASEELIGRIPAGIVRVSESGLKSAEDIVRLRELGYDAFLIGERFMTEVDPGLALQRLLDTARDWNGHEGQKGQNVGAQR
jgi:indole-3-glycerol phosphate synthase